MIIQTQTARPRATHLPVFVSPAIRSRQQRLAILIASGKTPAEALQELEGTPRKVDPNVRQNDGSKPKRCILGGREFDSVMEAANAFEISENTARKLVTWL